MSVAGPARNLWKRKLERLSAAHRAAQEDLLVAIHEAKEAGISQRDLAHMVGDKSGSGISAKAAKGRAIKEARKK